MSEITYENIKPLIESAEQEGSMMKCVFKCPVSGTTVESQAAIQKGRGLADRAKESAKRSLSWRIRWGVSRLVRSALGYGIGGRVAGDVAGQAVSGAAEKVGQGFSESEKQAAIEQAFKNVSSQFVFDGKKNTWVAATVAADILTDFAGQLNSAPVSQNYDRGVLARMLVEVAQADGNLAAEEKDFLAGFISSDLGTVDELAGKPRLSPAELAEVSSGPARETMLMIAWALACTDKELAQAEQQRLAAFTEALGVADTRAAELKRYAQRFVIDQAMEGVYPGGVVDEGAKAEVYHFAERIGLDRNEAERVEIRYRKRNNMV